MSLADLMKVRRNGHAFWVKNIRELEHGVFVGECDNDGIPGFDIGSKVAFVADEVIDSLFHTRSAIQ